MALMVALGNVGSLLSAGKTLFTHEKIAISSDALNHASINDGIHLAERQRSVEIFIYRHYDMTHLNALVAEEYYCERDVDICVGTLSKAAGCHGGLIACSKRWKRLIRSRGRSFILSTATPTPIVAAAHAAVVVARKETWRRREIWKRVQDFCAFTRIPINSPIISLIVGSEEKDLQASRSLLKSGFHVTAIRPPTVPPDSCRLRVTLSATHTRNDIRRFTAALSHCVNFQEIGVHGSGGYARL